MKTILHCIDTTGPGGAETVFSQLAHRVSTEKYRPIVLLRGNGWLFDELRRHDLNPVLCDSKGSFNWSFLRRLIAIIKQEKVSVIQSHLLGSNVYCSIAGRLTSTPVISTFHGSVDISRNERLRFLKLGAIRLGSKKVIAVSRDLERDLREKAPFSRQQLAVIYNGIDTGIFSRPPSRQLRRSNNWSDDDIIVGCLGNIRPAKAYDTLLGVAKLLDQGDFPYRFVVAGQCTGRLADEIFALRAELNLENRVIFLGFVDDPAEFLSNIDIFLSTSRSEGMPLSAIQAMSSRRPIVATNCGGYRELIADRENGLLAEVDDAAQIADALKTLSGDPALRDKLVHNARETAVSKYDLAAMVANYEALYDSATRS